MAGWYHRFVSQFPQLKEPLSALKQKENKFIRISSCQASFEKLKQHLDFNLLLMVYTYASDADLGAVLAQQTGLGAKSSPLPVSL